MDQLSLIKQPIEAELSEFIGLFNDSLSHTDGMLEQVLNFIRQRAGKRMRPMLILLSARVFGNVTPVTQRAAVALELLHTASLVHDDVVDEAAERRGQSSVNASYDNKIAVLVGDYILSTALINISKTNRIDIVEYLSRLGQTLANGEILQLTNISNERITEEVYYDVIKQKTAALFEACCTMGAMSVGASKDDVKALAEFGQKLGIIFQIRDDIFDYYDNKEIGKPTGNDMAEGKLTLPAIHAILSTRNEAMMAIAKRVKQRSVTPEEIAELVQFTKDNGGIEYAEATMQRMHSECLAILNRYDMPAEVRQSLVTYLDFVIDRSL